MTIHLRITVIFDPDTESRATVKRRFTKAINGELARVPQWDDPEWEEKRAAILKSRRSPKPRPRVQKQEVSGERIKQLEGIVQSAGVSDRHWDAYVSYFQSGETYTSIAKRYGVTAARISQMAKLARKRLYLELTRQGMAQGDAKDLVLGVRLVKEESDEEPREDGGE